MSLAAQVAQASPLAAIFERYHVGWETRNPEMIASLHWEDTIFYGCRAAASPSPTPRPAPRV